jgi:hypothetical protein
MKPGAVSRTIAIVALLCAAAIPLALLGAAAEEDAIVIHPNGSDGTEFWVRPSDEIVLRWGWGACTRGQVTAFVRALDSTYLLDGIPLQAQWSSPSEDRSLSGYCTGGKNKGWVAHWEYPLGNLPPGDHILHSMVVLKHPVTDGIDLNGDGRPDLYNGTRFDEEIIFHVAMPTIVASPVGDWMWTNQFAALTQLSVSVYDSRASMEEGQSPIWKGRPDTDENGFASVSFSPLDVQPGNYLTVSDGITQKEMEIEPITIDVFDLEQGIISGTAPQNRYVRVVAANSPEAGDQKVLETTSDQYGDWSTDFDVAFTDQWRAWSFAQIFDDDGDANEAGPPLPNTRFTVFPESRRLEGYEWPDGATVILRVADKSECVGDGTGPFFTVDFPADCDVVAGNEVTLSAGETSRTHTVQNLALTDVDEGANTVSGTSDSEATVHAWVHGFFNETELWPRADASGNWVADFGDFTLLAGMCGQVEIVDEGNATALDWCVPGP